MKQKILEALKQGYKNLGMSEEAFERVAAFGETFIKEESEIANFVKGAEAILKSEQSAADKVRTKASEEKKALESRIAELEDKLGDKTEPEQKTEQETVSNQADIAKMVSEAVLAAVKPLSDELARLKGETEKKSAIKEAKERFFANKHANKYTRERDDAWEDAFEVFEATGSKMTADELHDKAMAYFKKYASRKGVDTDKPLESEGSGDGLEKAKELVELLKK